MDPFLDPVPGRTLADRWRIDASHRQGGLSTAYRVDDLQAGEVREIQIFSGGLFEAADQASEFSDILMPWTRVESDSVVRVHEVVLLDPGNLVLVTALPAGESLRVRLKERKRLPTDEVVAIGASALRGLEAIHAASLVHGDLKPQTIFVEGTGAAARAVLVDGGVTPGLWSAKDLGDRTALIGTPYYAPVEQFGGDSPTVQSDLYNVAAVLYECLTGSLPWPGRTLLEVFQAKLGKEIPPMSRFAPDLEIDPELESAIVHGCAADRHDRYATAQAFLERLEEAG